MTGIRIDTSNVVASIFRDPLAIVGGQKYLCGACSYRKPAGPALVPVAV